MSQIVVSRNSNRDIKMRNVELLLDGEFVTDLPFGAREELEIEPGSHKLTATNRAFTQSTDFDIEEGQNLSFRIVAVPLRGLWSIVSMLGTVPSKVVIEPVEPTP